MRRETSLPAYDSRHVLLEHAVLRTVSGSEHGADTADNGGKIDPQLEEIELGWSVKGADVAYTIFEISAGEVYVNIVIVLDQWLIEPQAVVLCRARTLCRMYDCAARLHDAKLIGNIKVLVPV